MNAELVSHSSVSDRGLYFIAIPNADSFPETVSLPSEKFAVFLALDATGLHHTVISKLVVPLLRAGAVYFCCYGPDCKRVHDIIDEEELANVHDGDDSVIMTTWHDDDSLEDALWFFVFNSYPDDKYFDRCKSGLAISIGNRDWDKKIPEELKNLAK